MDSFIKNKEKYIDRLISSIPAVVCEYTISLTGEIKFFYISSKCKEILGYDSNFFLEDSNRFWNLIKDEDRKKILTAKNKIDFKSRFFEEVRIETANNGERWIQMSSLRSSDFNVENRVWKGFLFDITDKKIKENELKKMVIKDSLTGAYNKQYFYKRVERKIVEYLTFGNKFSILFLDLDGFKEVNDKYGHLIGDEILKTFVIKISEIIRPIDIIGRLGGDEFCILFSEMNLSQSMKIAEECRKIAENISVETDKGRVGITISGGIAEITDKTLDLFTLISRADEAMYLAKGIGKNSIVAVE
mgnify:CR=1 FL=1